jgi:biopolymer transport protein ExbD
MAKPARKYDVWFVNGNTVYKEVPFEVVTDWVQQARLGADDMVKPSGSPNWFKVANQTLFEPYLPRPEPQKTGDAAESYEPIELDFNWKRRHEDEDNDVDMIPLIDISLVLLIFFMMTTTVAAISRIRVPSMANASKIETEANILRIDIDKTSGGVLYGTAKKNDNAKEGFGDLKDENVLFEKFNILLANEQKVPTVRIAAHGDLPYETVERVMKKLDEMQANGLIESYHIEVTERPAR